jgi:hypothetical protein
LISSNDIERNGFKWFSADTIPAKLPNKEPILINTDRENGDGIHWITAYKERPGSVFVYDPLGPRNKRNNNRLIMDSLKKSGSVSLYIGKDQSNASNLCGWLSLLVAGYLNAEHPDKAESLILKKMAGDSTKTVVSEFGVKYA